MNKKWLLFVLLLALSWLLYLPILITENEIMILLLMFKIIYGNPFLIILFGWLVFRKTRYKPQVSLGIAVLIVGLAFLPEMTHKASIEIKEFWHYSKEWSSNEMEQKLYPSNMITYPSFKEVDVQKSNKHLTILLEAEPMDDEKKFSEDLVKHVHSTSYLVSHYKYFMTITFKVKHRNMIYLFEGIPLDANYDQLNQFIQSNMRVTMDDKKS